MEHLVGFPFVCQGGLLCSENCNVKMSGEVKVTATGEVKRFTNRTFDKSLQSVVDKLQRGGEMEWLSLDRIIMFDDICPLAPWEAPRHIWTPAYRWSDLSGWQ